MTGYGKATGSFEGKKVSVEVKSLNSKSMDLYIRIAPFYREKELELRRFKRMLANWSCDVGCEIQQVEEAKSSAFAGRDRGSTPGISRK